MRPLFGLQMINTRLLVVLYFAFALILAPFNLLSFDTYYYWNWSRHLALSYYDGSPLIAYLMKLTTMVFGDTVFALSFLGIVLAAATGFVIYQTARLFLSKKGSNIALALWLFSPLTTMDLFRETTYDNPLLLFWALTIFFTLRFLKENATRDLYFTGISIGLMMLSKYTGFNLVLALLFFLISTNYRVLFKNYHFYLTMLLALVIFSPVLIWNYQHNWESFTYQLANHQLETAVNPLKNIIRSFLVIFLPALNFMLLPTVICQMHKASSKEIAVKLCVTICTFFFYFNLLLSAKIGLKPCWLSPYLISSALLGGYCLEVLQYRRFIMGLLGLSGILSLVILASNTYLINPLSSNKHIYYQLIQQFNQAYPNQPPIVFTGGWLEARGLFFLKSKPMVYTFPCYGSENQFAEWSAPIKQQIKDKQIKEVLYIDLIDMPYDSSSCLASYFEHCEKVYSQRDAKKPEYQLIAYRCH